MKLKILTITIISILTLKAQAASYHEVVRVIQKYLHKHDKYVKPGSRAFFLGQGQKAKTVLLLHGLSDSPTSMREVAKVYFKKGYNVIAPRLLDHGLIPEVREHMRANVTLKDWRNQVLWYFDLAKRISSIGKVSVAGYSMGGALALDLAYKETEEVESLVFIAPMFQMYLHYLTFTTIPLRYLGIVTPKGVEETSFFYPDINTNQTYHASELSDYLRKEIIPNISDELESIPKLVFLTSHDTTIDNDYIKEESLIPLNIEEGNLIEYSVSFNETEVLHRDLPVATINSTGERNKFLPSLKSKIDLFLQEL